MKNKNTTISAELVRALFASVGMAILCILALCFVMILASASMEFAIFFNEHVFLFIILFLLLFSLLTIVFYLMLVKKRIRYLEEIIRAIGNISNGDLDVVIPVKTTDELGKMADTINSMAYRLKTSTEEERRLEKTKNDLITNVSHDLRTPLTSALGYIDLINHTDCKEEEKLRKYATIAYEQCSELKTLIDELFEFSKLSNPGIVLNIAQISMNEFLEQVIVGFIPELEQIGMEYRLKLPGEKIAVNADPVLLARVFDNLVNNAIKYGLEGKYFDITLRKENEEAVVGITNYGEPIAKEDLPYVFERFYRANKARSGKKKGSGLGLAIVKSIVELHNGSIEASSSDGGTVFEVRLKIT
ncbi:MAG: sensor histidine kinase [Pseudomonadota bacterium]